VMKALSAARASDRAENLRKVVKEMLSLELIGIIGLLFGLVVYGMVATYLERRTVTAVEREAEAQKGVRTA
jgi:hypothetical protein